MVSEILLTEKQYRKIISTLWRVHLNEIHLNSGFLLGYRLTAEEIQSMLLSNDWAEIMDYVVELTISELVKESFKINEVK